MYTARPIRPWTLWKRVLGCDALFISITTSPAINEPRAMKLRPEWMYVPCTFCFCVDVGWRRRIDWMRTRTPAELRSYKSRSAQNRETCQSTYWMIGEETKVCFKYSRPDERCQDPCASLGYHGCACPESSVMSLWKLQGTSTCEEVPLEALLRLLGHISRSAQKRFFLISCRIVLWHTCSWCHVFWYTMLKHR